MVDLIKNLSLINSVNISIRESRVRDELKDWLSSFDTASATECFTAVNLLKQRLEGEDEDNSGN